MTIKNELTSTMQFIKHMHKEII